MPAEISWWCYLSATGRWALVNYACMYPTISMQWYVCVYIYIHIYVHDLDVCNANPGVITPPPEGQKYLRRYFLDSPLNKRLLWISLEIPLNSIAFHSIFMGYPSGASETDVFDKEFNKKSIVWGTFFFHFQWSAVMDSIRFQLAFNLISIRKVNAKK